MPDDRSIVNSRESCVRVTSPHSIDVSDPVTAGGVEAWLTDFAEFTNLDLSVLGYTSRNAPEDAQPRQGFIGIYQIPPRAMGLPDGLWLLLGLLRNLRLLRGVLLVHRIELVIPLKILAPKRKQLLVIHTDLDKQSRFKSGKKWQLRGPTYRAYEGAALRVAHQILVHSQEEFKRIRRINRYTSFQPQWFNDEIFSHFKNKEAQGNNRRDLILWVGRFEAVKNPMMALEAFGLSAGNHHYSLTLVGSGSLEHEIKARIAAMGLQSRISVVPPMTPRELAREFLTASILLHTAYFEGGPRVIPEALAQGMFVVAPVQSDPSLWGSEGGCGINVQSYDSESLSSALFQATLAPPARIPVSRLKASSLSRQVREIDTILESIGRRS